MDEHIAETVYSQQLIKVGSAISWQWHWIVDKSLVPGTLITIPITKMFVCSIEQLFFHVAGYIAIQYKLIDGQVKLCNVFIRKIRNDIAEIPLVVDGWPTNNNRVDFLISTSNLAGGKSHVVVKCWPTIWAKFATDEFGQANATDPFKKMRRCLGDITYIDRSVPNWPKPERSDTYYDYVGDTLVYAEKYETDELKTIVATTYYHQPGLIKLRRDGVVKLYVFYNTEIIEQHFEQYIDIQHDIVVRQSTATSNREIRINIAIATMSLDRLTTSIIYKIHEYDDIQPYFEASLAEREQCCRLARSGHARRIDGSMSVDEFERLVSWDGVDRAC